MGFQPMTLCDKGWLVARLCDAVVTSYSMCQVIIWLCDRTMRFQSKTHITPLFTIESTVALWSQHLAWSQKIMGLNPIWVHLELGLFFSSFQLMLSLSFYLISPNITHFGDYS